MLSEIAQFCMAIFPFFFPKQPCEIEQFQKVSIRAKFVKQQFFFFEKRMQGTHCKKKNKKPQQQAQKQRQQKQPQHNNVAHVFMFVLMTTHE